MLQSFKKFSWLLLLASGLQTSWAFSLLGPVANGGDAWQVEEIGYDPIPANAGAPPFFADPAPTGPKNIGEEYRRNTPVMYYACDASFLDFFGSSGSTAIDQAFTIMNNSLTNVDGYSPALTEYPLISQGENYSASALSLLDVKSKTLALLVEQMGLADAVRYVWCLHNRFHQGTVPCPVGMYYQVIMRNLDITASPLNQVQYSPYVNGSLYSYLIDEICDEPNVAPPSADALELLVDPLVYNPPVASLDEAGLLNGSFYTGLTRDDEAGLRYLLSTNNVLFESPYAGSTLVSSTGSTGGTNYGAPFVLYSSNYTAFVEAALTNDPAALTNLYPGLIIDSFSNYFTVVYTTNYYFAYFTNVIGAPAGTQKAVYGQTVTPSVVTDYAYVFGNVFVFSNGFSSSTTATLLTTNVVQPVGAGAGTFTTNVTLQNITLPVPSGDFYIWTNPCGPNLILYTILTNPVVATTNATLVSSNSSGLYYSQTLITYSTTHAFIAEPIICGVVTSTGTATNTPGLYEGIGHMQFIKTSYDSLTGIFYEPVTNTYQMTLVFNNEPSTQTYERVVTQPDFLFSAADLLPGPAAVNTVNVAVARSTPIFQSSFTNGLAGPGVITPGTTIVYNKVGPVYLNEGPAYLNLYDAGLDDFVWASFDGTTNDPVVYPNGTSLANLANQVLVNLTPAILPAGTNGVAYAPTTFVATSGTFTAPFTWSLPSGGLPSGLTLSSGGTLSGTPAQSGTFDFILELTDSESRTVTWSYPITIN